MNDINIRQYSEDYLLAMIFAETLPSLLIGT